MPTWMSAAQQAELWDGRIHETAEGRGDVAPAGESPQLKERSLHNHRVRAQDWILGPRSRGDEGRVWPGPERYRAGKDHSKPHGGGDISGRDPEWSARKIGTLERGRYRASRASAVGGSNKVVTS